MNVRFITAAFALAALPLVAAAAPGSEQPAARPELREQNAKGAVAATPKQRAKVAKAQNKHARATVRDKSARDRSGKPDKQELSDKTRKVSAT